MLCAAAGRWHRCRCSRFFRANGAEGGEIEHDWCELPGGVGVNFRDAGADAGGIPGFGGQCVRLRLCADVGNDARHAADKRFAVGGDEALFVAGVVAGKGAKMQRGFANVYVAVLDVFADLGEKSGGGCARQAQQDAVCPRKNP